MCFNGLCRFICLLNLQWRSVGMGVVGGERHVIITMSPPRGLNNEASIPSRVRFYVKTGGRGPMINKCVGLR